MTILTITGILKKKWEDRRTEKKRYEDWTKMEEENGRRQLSLRKSKNISLQLAHRRHIINLKEKIRDTLTEMRRKIL